MNARIGRIAATSVAITALAIPAVAMGAASPAQAATKQYTAAQVAKHRTPSNCWATINGTVYNFTNWISRHPGGSGAIISICGKDGSSAFNSQHGGNGGVATMLAAYKIGTLKK